MSGRLSIVSLLLLVLLAAFSCASRRTFTAQEQEQLESDFGHVLEAKAREQENSAYLLQVKIKTPEIRKKFKLEVYFQNDSLSFYSPGFLGKGTFKGIVYGDSLRFYLPSEKACFQGPWYRLTEPDLEYWRDVFEFIRGLLQGDYLPEQRGEMTARRYVIGRPEAGPQIAGQASDWDYCYLFGGNKLKRMFYAWAKDRLSADIKIKNYRDEFPYFYLEVAKLAYRNDLRRADNPQARPFKSEIRIDFLEQRYNLKIPVEKFQLEIPAEAEPIEGLILE